MNKIVFNIYDSCKPVLYDMRQPKLFGIEKFEEYTHIFFEIGNKIKSGSYYTEVLEKIFDIETNSYIYVCDDVFTGRKE